MYYFMNKKFSTLLASALLASAFSTASAANTFTTAGLQNGVKEGDVVALFTVAEDASKLLQLQSDGTVANVSVTNALKSTFTDASDGKEVFTNAQSALWKIASVKTSETGIPVYQFVNKATGVYLAVDLKTAPTVQVTGSNPSVSADAAKLSSTGNKNWSLKDGKLYAYANDSIYSLVVNGDKIKLQAVKGNISESGVTDGAQALYIADLATARSGESKLTLSAKAFNTLMGLTGNDGKLHFNNNKDVTSTQKNILKDTKWTAEATSGENTTLYFTNGKTVEGYKDDLSGKEQRKQYLMVDTFYYDENTPAYFKLKVDTMNYTIGGTGTKPVAKRPNEAAQFTAEYYYANDSIAIKAVKAPKKTGEIFWTGTQVAVDNYANPIALRSLADVTVLTVASAAVTAASPNGYVLPLIQPFATSGGDATEIAATKVFNLQIKNEAKDYSPLIRASKLTDKYLVAASTTTTTQVEEVDASNVYAQWAFVPGVSGYYTIQNRAIPELVYYAGPVSKVKDANGKVVADTYVLGTDTLKVAAVTLNEDNFYTEKVNDKNVKYDYSGAYYTGKTDGISQSFIINPVSPFLSTLAAQTTKDSVMVLGATEEAVVWSLVKAGDPVVYGLEIEGLPRLKKQLYYIATFDADNNKYYVQANGDTDQFEITKADSRAAANLTKFEIRNVAEGQYNLIATTTGVNSGNETKMTINATPAKPILEVSIPTSEKNDLFALNKSQVNLYRKLTAEDGVLGNAKIFMNNENSRYLYENSQNIVANNGNKIAKDSLNFLGIFNTAALTKNAALYVDTAYVEREGVYMPQYMFAVGVTEVEAHDAIACSYEHNHFDNAGNKVDALHCSHATPATLGYKAGRYLVALTDSIEGVNNHPGRYDGATRLAFVDAIHRVAEDSLIIKNSKWTDNSKQIVEGEEKTYASKDTIKIADNALNVATFALLIKDQADQSFYLQTAGGYVRILNGVPVLTDDKEDAAVFNIAATEEEATANEAIEAAGVQVIGGKGAVTVQGAAGKVITVANVLGQTIANQVAASDNVTIAAPAGIVVVAVEGEATKVVVK